MAEGIAKSAPLSQTEIKPQEKPSLKPLGLSDLSYSPHVYMHLGVVEPDRYNDFTNEQIGTLIKWSDAKDLPTFIDKMKDLQSKLGTSEVGVSKLNQLYNWAKISLKINELQAIRSTYASNF